ncbi:MAG: hypothetical protein DMF70_03745 [Acidobacteria bacterium]|nr:MAG: hypothetical protein DMF70_03745 [Acidobacteriota bacterium]
MKGIAKNIILVAVVLTSAFGLCSLTSAETPKLVQFHMALLKRGPKWETTAAAERNKIMQQHLANVLSMLDSGKAVIAGPMEDNADVAGIFILRAESAEEAKGWVDADPVVKSGLFAAEMHPWWSEDIFKKANTSPLKFETVYLGFLKKGPNRKDGDDKVPEIQELQKAHIANINRLAKLGKLVVAGPFGDDGVLRGIFVFRVGSLAEAHELCATDPMVKIDRLRVELHPWNVPEGVLP